MSLSSTLTAPLVTHLQSLPAIATQSAGVYVGDAPASTAPVVRVDLLSAPLTASTWGDRTAREWSFRLTVIGLQTSISVVRAIVDAIGEATHDVFWSADGYHIIDSRITDIAETALADGDTRVHHYTLRLDVTAES